MIGYNVIADETIHSGKYCFKIQHDSERTFYFYTNSEKTLKSWMRALMKVTISRNYAGKKETIGFHNPSFNVTVVIPTFTNNDTKVEKYYRTCLIIQFHSNGIVGNSASNATTTPIHDYGR